MHQHFRCIDTLAAAINCQQQHTCSIGVRTTSKHSATHSQHRRTSSINTLAASARSLHWHIDSFAHRQTKHQYNCSSDTNWVCAHNRGCADTPNSVQLRNWGACAVYTPPILSSYKIGGVYTPPILSYDQIGGIRQDWGA